MYIVAKLKKSNENTDIEKQRVTAHVHIILRMRFRNLNKFVLKFVVCETIVIGQLFHKK